MFKPVQIVPALPGWTATFKNDDATICLPVACWVLMVDNYQHKIEAVVQAPDSHQMLPVTEMHFLNYLFSHYDFGDV